MAAFTAADVKALREKTGAGMMDAKKALEAADGDIEAAVDALRAKLGDGGRCFVVVLDHETLTKDRVIGVARVDFPLSDTIQTCDAVAGRLTRKGEDAGGVSLGVEYVSAHGVSVLPWSPFPSVHDRLRVGDAPS